MSINLGGYSANSKLDVEANTLAAKVVLRPPDWSAYPSAPGGSYSRKYITGNLAGATSGSLWQFRWTNPALLCAVKRISVNMVGTSSAAATATPISLFFARLFSVAGTGATAFSGANSDGKRNRLHEPTALNDMRTAAGTGALGNGTWVLDADALASMYLTWVLPAAGIVDGSYEMFLGGKLYPLFEALPGEAPIVLAAQEGLDITMAGTSASNNYTFAVKIEWDELPLI